MDRPGHGKQALDAHSIPNAPHVWLLPKDEV